ncbi:MAG: ISNCY family transposase, partial [Chloroflexi bacterium CG07_land_8_20_14_0_80_51_10]
QATQVAQKLLNTFDQFVPLVEQVINQTTRRVLQGESVPADEKLVSLFEPHTRIISKGKVNRPTEFGRAIWLDEVDGGIISRYEILDGNPADAKQIKPTLDHHVSVFHKSPDLLTGDRGTYSADNDEYAQSKGVKHTAIPKPGTKSPERVSHEKQPWFRRGHKWRSGIEGRISLLKRRHKLGRCLYHGEDGMERWVGWGVIAHDLWIIASKTAS